jgi:phospholipid/cholesterol/gamma-HCH transport system substrate-binding protein
VIRSLVDRMGRFVSPYVVLGIVASIGVFAVLWATYKDVFRDLAAGPRREVTATFRDTKMLQAGDPVRVRGVDVGGIKEIKPAGDRRTTEVVMKIDADVDLHEDARAKVAWRTLLGGNWVVEIDPGSSKAGPLRDGRIPLERTNVPVELDDVTSVVSGRARRGLERIPGELSDAFAERATLRRLSSALAGAAPDLERGLRALRGTEPDHDLEMLVDEAAKVTEALDAPDDRLRRLVADTAATLRVTARRALDLRSTIARAPATLDEVDRAVTALDHTLEQVDPLLEEVREPAGDVAPAVRDLRPVVVDANTVLDRARPLLAGLRPAVESLATASRDALPLLDELQPSLDRLDKVILPYLNEVDPDTKRTTAEMVGPALGGLGNVAAPKDRNGHALRFPATTGSSFFYLPCQTYLGNPDKNGKLLECQELNEMLESILTWNPLGPAPGTAPDPARRGSTGPAGDGDADEEEDR